MTVATNNHILIDDKGVARIDGTRLKVIHLVKAMMAQKLNPEQLREEFPHLTLAQIHDALSYYYDHEAEIQAELRAADDLVEKLREEAGPSPVAARLRAEGKLRR